MKRYSKPIVFFLVLVLLLLSQVSSTRAWGDEGHRFINRVAAQKLPDDMPAFFRQAAARLEFLGPEPDRWRDNKELFFALREVNAPDHFVDIDKPDNFREIPNDRYKYMEFLNAQGKDPKDVGFLPYSIMEWYEKVQVLFRLWRNTQNQAEREQIEQNIIYYAGVLGHYVADGSQPLHATIHYNGWTGAANAENYTREPLHWRFEGEYVKAQIKAEDFSGMVNRATKLKDPFADTLMFLFESYNNVEPLYRMDKTARWDDRNTNAESKQFVSKRLAAGSQMLANLWYTAWLDSAK